VIDALPHLDDRAQHDTHATIQGVVCGLYSVRSLSLIANRVGWMCVVLRCVGGDEERGDDDSDDDDDGRIQRPLAPYLDAQGLQYGLPPRLITPEPSNLALHDVHLHRESVDQCVGAYGGVGAAAAAAGYLKQSGCHRPPRALTRCGPSPLPQPAAHCSPNLTS
jgi:hypothetical protein